MKKFNYNEFINLLILVLITMILGYLVLSKNIYNYVEPSYVKNIYLVLIVIPILTVVQGMKVFTFNSREDNFYNIIPIVIALGIIIFVIFKEEIFRIKEFIIMLINKSIF